MKKYDRPPKDVLEEKLNTKNSRLNYHHLYAAAILAVFDALESLEMLNVGEAKIKLKSICRTAEQLHPLPPEETEQRG